MKFVKIFLLFWISAGVAGAQEVAAKKPLVVTSINPIYQILLAITGDQNNSLRAMNPAISEHDYQLKKSDVEAVFRADLVFYVDDDLEKNFAKFLRGKKSYKLSEINGIKLLPARNDSKKIDPHLWMNPENALKIAEFMAKKISEIDEANAKKYQKNLAKFRKEIAETEKVIRDELLPIKGAGYVFFHDGYQYFEDYFGLKPLKVIVQNHEQELTIKEARELDLLVRSGKVKCVFGDAYDEKNSAKKLARNYKIKFASLDLLGREGGYADLLLKIAEVMRGCLL